MTDQTKKSVNLLPEYLRTDKNSKFLASTIDQLIQTPQLERISGYVGSKITPNFDPTTDFYIPEALALRTEYPLEPALVLKDQYSNITDVVAYDDIINEVGIQGGKNLNLDRLFRSNFYSYNPLIDWDKLVNYDQYYWLFDAAESILIDQSEIDVELSIVGQATYLMPNGHYLSNGMKLVFLADVIPSTYKNAEFIVEGVGSSIKLINFSLLTVNESISRVVDETFDSASFDTFPFDGDKRLPLDPEYITINRASTDLNSWSRYNRWIHKDVITVTAAINNQIPVFPLNSRARRPIIEFNANIQLYNFGTTGIRSVDLIDTTTTDALKTVAGSLGYYVDGVLLEKGHRVIFNADTDSTVRGLIYEVDFDISEDPPVLQLKLDSAVIANQYAVDALRMVIGLIPENLAYDLNGDNAVTLADAIAYEKIAVGLPIGFTPSETSNYNALMEDISQEATPTDLSSVSVNAGTGFTGTSWHYSAATNTWLYSQQHTTLNQPPLFDLCDSSGFSYSNTVYHNSNFSGTKIFGYDVGTGSNDPILGFPLNYQNSIGVGSYLFRNYFMTDTISVVVDKVSSTISTGVTYIKVNDPETVLTNVWKDADDYQIPIIEIQTINTATTTLKVTAFDNPITLPDSVLVYLSGKQIPVTFNKVNADLIISSDNTFNVNDTVQIKFISDQIPNSNGHYETPLSLTNNPLNGPIATMTLSELSDHVNSMVSRLPAFVGTFPGNSNLRDISDFAKFGSRLIINSNPIAFSQLFLGKKEHNVVDAIRYAGDQYNQFKMNMLRACSATSDQLSAADALDEILLAINSTKDLKSPYYTSDMLGFGLDKVITEYTVTDINTVVYPTGAGVAFDLSTLSSNAILLYLNGVQLVEGADYVFDAIDETVIISAATTVGDTISICYYPSTIGSFVPSTPTKLGLYPKFAPQLYVDSTFINAPVVMIQGHDGSVIPAYGDYRDAIVIEFEKRIYNNIKVAYNSKIFDINAVRPGAFRDTSYTVSDTNSIIRKDFVKWAGQYNIDTTTHTGFDENNPYTWNYTGSFDTLSGAPVNGYWRGVFKYFYDTDRPHTHPWEMLGYTNEPELWGFYYDWTDSVKRPALISAITSGITAIPPDAVIDSNYARPGFESIVPVDEEGDLRDPSSFLTTEIGYADKIANWKFGDHAPAEAAWDRSSYYPFAINAAAALLNPCTYTSRLYDVSRTSVNSLNQVTYLTDDLYLNPSKLIVEGDIAGFGVYILERGKQKDQTYYSKLQQDLTYLNFNLFHKLGGFTSKDKLQITIDSIDPVSSSSGAILPPEDYSLILNVSNPIKSANISGIVVQKHNGKFLVKGYDRSNPYFEIFNPIKTVTSGAITVGGVSESFTEWQAGSTSGNVELSAIEITTANSVTSRYYKAGQLVRYSGAYYRVKVGHTAQNVFTPALFAKLPSLPMKGGATAQLSTRFESVVTQIPYGTEFTNIQDVYDLCIGYGAYLESQGFVFDEFNIDLNEMLDWKYTGKEFLYWTTQNWADNNLITLSPFANYLKYTYIDSIVDNVSTGKYEYSLLKADGKSFPITNFNMSREDGVCIIKTSGTEEGIFFATLNSVQKEHGMVFNNSTIFNDTIYDIETGYKQRRIKLSGFRTKNWNGDFSSPGFVYDNVETNDWAAYGSYLPSTVIRYNGSYYSANKSIVGTATFDFSKWTKLSSNPVPQLLPNFDYKINQFEDYYSLDIDNFDVGQQKAAQHLSGYTPRPYLSNIIIDPIAQYKFYQGFIKEKGTKNSIDKFSKAVSSQLVGAIEFKEEWAFRVGHYGGFETYNELEFVLTEGTTLENPYVVSLVDSIPSSPSQLISYITPASLLITPSSYEPATTFDTVTGTYDDNILELITAGYVRLDDVTSTAYNKNSLLDIANNSLINEGDTIWVGFLENGGWTVSRYNMQPSKITGVFVSAPAAEITFVTDSHHSIAIGDIISVVRFNEQVNGVHIVTAVPALNQFTVASKLSSIANAELLSYGELFKFDQARYTNLKELSNINNLLALSSGANIWIDSGVDGKWQVYEKLQNYSTASMFESTNSPIGQQLGRAMFSKDASPVFLASTPGWTLNSPPSVGKVWVYDKINNVFVKQYDYAINDTVNTYCQSSTATQFGYSLSYDVGKRLYFAGAPAASKIRAPLTTGSVVISTGTGTAKAFDNEGIVKISSRNLQFNLEHTEVVLVSPNAATSSTAQYARFGHSIYNNQVPSNTSTTLLVGAPGEYPNTGTGKVYAYVVTTSTTTSTVTVSSHPSGINVLTTSSIVLTDSSRWGHKIAGSDSGNIIAISAPGYVNASKVGTVQLYNSQLHWVQSLTSPFGTSDRFGDEVVVSSSGKYIAVSSVNAKLTIETQGKVAIYTYTNGSYVMTQIISNPLSNHNLKFGYAIAISDDDSSLAVSSLGTNRSQSVRFDVNTKTGETTFDNRSTQIITSVPDSGAVYLYENLGGYFIQADELNYASILPGSRYGSSLLISNNGVFVGAPSYAGIGVTPLTDDSKIYKFDKIDNSVSSWNLSREQEPLVDITTLKRIALIDSLTEEVIEYLDAIDPVKGKIAGIAEQELSYKSAFDPATYSIGMASSINDTETNWIDEHLGELWWDLSTAKYTWYEQGDAIYRKNNWGKLFPGASIDVYEWVKSDLLPSEWAAQADTNQGLTNGISGQPKYPDNSIISVKQVFNNVTNAFENVYFFWVKNKVNIPNTPNRRISSYQVASLIADPVANGLMFAEILSANEVAFANVQRTLIGDRINANLVIDTGTNIPRHTEWMLLEENNETSVPAAALEKKLFDSLLGHDSAGTVVPSASLTYRNRYGLGIRPQQTLFKNRLEALRNLIEFSNSILLANKIRDNYSFTNLNSQDEVPLTSSGEYDFIVEDNAHLDLIVTTNYVRAELQCFVYNGSIRSAVITNPGYGYSLPPKVTIGDSTSAAEILTTINEQGQIVYATVINPGSGFVDAPAAIVRPHTVIVLVDEQSANKWASYAVNYDVTSSWTKTKTQSYDVRNYWTYIDWISENYNQFKDFNYLISGTSDLNQLTTDIGDYVKVKNAGDGRYAILERTSDVGNFAPSYNIVYRELGTIKILDTLWSYTNSSYSYDDATLDETLYDQIPDKELAYVLTALRNDIFIKDLKINWNLFFFKAVKYALTEQKLLDWAFKTSFINVNNKGNTLDQRPVYKLDNDTSIEDYVKEVKPYHTQIRNFISGYNYTETDGASVYTTDFDLPSYFNTATNQFEVVTFANTATINQQPWKSWADNFTSTIATIIVSNSGAGYTEYPTVTISGGGPYVTSTATANAYIRNTGIYQIRVTNSGAGYTENPTVTISGGGPSVSKTATASATLLNQTIRKNTIGMKFDRVRSTSEINNIVVTDTFVCTGKTDKFVLTWLADHNKLNIVPLLNGRLVLSADYTIEYFTETFNNYSKQYSRFVFLTTVPEEGQTFKITYNKNIDLFTAVDRIENFYTATTDLSLLMSGTEYPGIQLQGLPFSYSAPWGTTPYETTPWEDVIDYYSSAKLINTATLGQTTLALNTTTGLVPGQVLNILSASDHKIRTDTVITSVHKDTRTIEISCPSYHIKSVKSSSTLTGATVVYTTNHPFNGDIVVGDVAFISGITTSGYNGQYVISKIDNNHSFEVMSTGTVSVVVPSLSSTASVAISSILSKIDAHQEYVDSFVTTVTNTTTTLLTTYSDIATIARISVLVNGISTSSYQLIQDTVIASRAAVHVTGLNPSIVSTIGITLYGDPTVEFWKYDTNFAALTTSTSGGPFTAYTPSKIIDGDSFLSTTASYAPEELVPGHVLDSLGVNVYTKADDSYAIIITGAFGVSNVTTTTVSLSLAPTAAMGFIVNVGGQILNRSTSPQLSPNEFFIDGNIMTIARQGQGGPNRGGYTIVDAGGNGIIDSNVVTVNDATEALVQSLSSINDVRRAYVLVDGYAINEVTTTTDYGYMLTAVNSTNNRACAHVYNIPMGMHTIEAWFFDTNYNRFNTVTEEILSTFDEPPKTAFVLPKLVSTVGPISAQVIVEVGSVEDPYSRKRLAPPWVSYYIVLNGQLEFVIDDKNTRPSGTYNLDNVKVYANGIELRPGFDYAVNGVASTIILTPGYLIDNDQLAIMGLIDYEYLISGNILQLSSPIHDTTLKITSFVDNKEMMIRTERFNANISGRFTLSRPALNDNYVWVTLNGSPLIARYDFEILEDLKTIQLSQWVEINSSDDVFVTSIDSPKFGSQIVGYRVFDDMFGNLHYKRLSKYHSTTLAKELKYNDTEIYVQNATSLIPPNPARNIPGVVLIDGERIEFFSKNRNVLSQLRRSTLGTGPAFYSEAGTKVIDQSLQQTILYKDQTLIQTIPSSNTTTYSIMRVLGTTSTSDGITFVSDVNAIDQVTVYYGGRQLRKSSLAVHDKSKAYDTTSTSVTIVPPEFTITITNPNYVSLANQYVIDSGNMIIGVIPEDLAYDLNGDGAVTIDDTIAYQKIADGIPIGFTPVATSNYADLINIQQLSLNIAEVISTGTRITVVQKQGYIWTGTESLLSSNVIQAKFLRAKEAELPDIYYYGGDPNLTDDGDIPLTDDDNIPLQGH